MSHIYLRLARAVKGGGLAFAACLLTLFTFAVSAHAEDYPLPTVPVASDGAIGSNIDWEGGKARNYYIEWQRFGASYVDAGVHREDPAIIAQGLKILDWGFAHQAADGSFAGTGDPFHSTTFFVEAAARAALQLKSYQPATYRLDASTYASAINRYTLGLHAAALWLLNPAVAVQGETLNQPYTHRRWMLAAALGEIGALSSDTLVSAAAVPFVQQGLALQLAQGYTAALTQNADGTIPPAVLLAPGQDAPAGTVKVVNASGVNPERSGYDVSYQCVGILMAERYIPFCPDSLRPQVKLMIHEGLKWEKSRIDAMGAVSIDGCSRMGLEYDRSGKLKTPDLGTIYQSFRIGSQQTSAPIYDVVATRMAKGYSPVSSSTVAVSGAVNANSAADGNPSAAWSIGLQQAGADYIQAGIDRENDSLIQRGLQIFDWGWARQAADGSFPGTTGSSWGTVQFTEAVSRAMLALKDYRPTTYRANLNLMALTIRRSAQNIHAAAAWLALPANAKSLNKSVLGYASRSFTTAAAFAEAAQATGDLGLAAAGASYAANGLAMQSPNGLLQEQGGTDVNTQATGLLFAARYNTACPDPITQSQVSSFVGGGLQWEQAYVAVNGNISGTSSPQTGTINQAFKTGYAIISSPLYATVINRIESR